MHFLVFVPCQTSQLEAVAKVAGLTPILGGHDVMPNAKGPDGELGTMLGWLSPTNPLMHVDHDQQTWVPSVVKDETGKPRYMVGFWKDKPPKENELRRSYTQPGVLVRLGDEQDTSYKSEEWKLPTPKTVYREAIYNDDGTMRWEVVRRFAWVCDEAQSLASIYDNDGELTMRWRVFCGEPSVQIDWILKLLQINYRILPEVASYLHFWVGEDKLYRLFCASFGVQLKE